MHFAFGGGRSIELAKYLLHHGVFPDLIWKEEKYARLVSACYSALQQKDSNVSWLSVCWSQTEHKPLPTDGIDEDLRSQAIEKAKELFYKYTFYARLPGLRPSSAVESEVGGD